MYKRNGLPKGPQRVGCSSCEIDKNKTEKDKIMNKVIHGHKIEKDLGLMGDCYFNNYGVRVYVTKEGRYLLQAMKMGRKIPNHWNDISESFYNENFSNPNLASVVKALEFLDPDFQE
jgi:hypothetical protein